ncbi:MAG TPA: hypothetical protein VHN11_03620, partial [Xanthobacteraceae bacterium]|nr:hypothetical protein [Xanthobacteraceae bacterium]
KKIPQNRTTQEDTQFPNTTIYENHYLAANFRLREAVQSAYLDGEKDGPRSYAATAWVIRGTVP